MAAPEMSSSDGTPAAPEEGPVCVTGATGYIGSSLVHALLRRGYIVHATARDTGKALRLFSSLCTNGRLKLFKADLNVEGSFDEAVKGCKGVLHVAASMEFGISVEENIEDHVRLKIIEPAVSGTINLLQACLRAGSVKRVIFTSSISTITAKDDEGRWRVTVNESSIIHSDGIWKTKPNGWVYVLSKLLTEETAFLFAREKGIDLVSIIPPTVGGQFLATGVPASVQVLLSPITGDPKLYPILVAVHSRLGSIALVHIEDICNAHIFLMENAKAQGRYICAAGSCVITQLTDLLASEYPSFSSKRPSEEFYPSIPSVICSKKLTDLGFKFRYDLRDIIKDSITCCIDSGFLKPPTTDPHQLGR